jgi:hypothetical protein
MIITKGLTEGDIVVIDYVNDDFTFTAEKPKQIMHDSDSMKKEEKRMMAYKCSTTGYEFTTEVSEHATVICPVNVKEKVEKQNEKISDKTRHDPITSVANTNTQPTIVVSNPSDSYYQTA